MEDDDDDFLYGTSSKSEASVSQPKPVETNLLDSSGIVSNLEAVADATNDAAMPPFSTLNANAPDENTADEPDGDAPGVGEDEDSEEDEDIEIIMVPTARSLDFRQRPQQQRVPSTSTPAVRAPQPSLTTEYTPIQRNDTGPSLAGPSSTYPHASTPQSQQPPSASHPPGPQSASQSQRSTSQVPPRTGTGTTPTLPPDDGIDTSTLPPATAPPSHPEIDPSVDGVFDGRSILEVDIAAMADKPWRRAGSDISDWFNYGFDELSWEAYCYRRRDVGDLANVLKANVLNFSGMQQDQLTALPPEVRQMVMTGTSAMMNSGPNPGMMGGGGGMMMDMGMMNSMGMGMNGEMGIPPQMMPVDQRGMIMQDGQGQGPVGSVGVGTVSVTPEQGASVGVGMMQDGFPPGAAMGMGMPGDFSMQDQSQMNQQMFPGPGMDGPVPQNVTPVPVSRGNTPAYRGQRGMGSGGMRGRGYPGRGRGRGGMYSSEGATPVVQRPASPLPPNVPTGPRNQNKYKDRDGNAAAVDGLDYGGDRGGGTRTPSGEPEERNSSRKRRGSPSMEEGRGSKRR